MKFCKAILTTSLVIAAGLVGPAAAQSGQSVYWQCVSGASPSYCPVSSTYPLPVTSGSASGQAVVGDSAAGAADSGSDPVKTGGVFVTAPATLTSGQRGTTQLDASQNTKQSVWTGASAIGTAAAMTDSTLNTTPRLGAQSYNMVFNGGIALWDREFTCDSSAVVNVTAGNTTELVSLLGTRIIHVCGFSVAMSAAGTAQWSQGTGTNCGTTNVVLSGAMPLATGTPWSISGGNSSVLRTTAGQALCLSAVTGNVVGFVSYARF